jgi:hypothetical protein
LFGTIGLLIFHDTPPNRDKASRRSRLIFIPYFSDNISETPPLFNILFPRSSVYEIGGIVKGIADRLGYYLILLFPCLERGFYDILTAFSTTVIPSIEAGLRVSYLNTIPPRCL